MKSPATQLYWKEHTSDVALRRCSLAAQGAWMHVLAILHQSDEYGVLRWPLKEIAAAANVPVRYLRELCDKKVLKGDDDFVSPFMHVPRHAGRAGDPVELVSANGGPCWFSARFVRDEWVRSRRGAGTRFTANNQPSRSPTGRVGERLGDGPASASAFASIDRSLRADRSLRGADELARALQETGYSDCSPFVPELLEAQQAGVTAKQIQEVAAEKAGKSVPYIAKTATGRVQDKARGATTAHGGAGASAPDPKIEAVKEKLRGIDDRMIDNRHLRDVLGLITQEQFDDRAKPLLEAKETLVAELKQLAPKGAGS